jgi:hypothetical protein
MTVFARRFATCVSFLMPNHAIEPTTPNRPRPLFRPKATTIFRVILGGAIGLLGSAAYAVFQYYHSAYWDGIGLAPSQPVLFSHRHHAGDLRIDCRFCHATVESAAFAGMPTTQTCLNCHSQVFADTPMLQPVIQSFATRQPLQWTRVTRLPDHVYFNHSAHLARGVSCIACHGDLRRMALTAKARPLDMRECIDCHRDSTSQQRTNDELLAAPSSSWSRVHDGKLPPENFPAQHLTNCSTCHH